MSIAKPAVYLSLFGLLVIASACTRPRTPRVDGSVPPLPQDAGVPLPCQFGSSDGGACSGAAMLDVDFCDRAWIEVTPSSGVLNQNLSVRARAKDSERNGLNVMWMADPDGTFADAAAATTTFHCATLGRKTLHMVAEDNRGCDSEGKVEIHCVPPNAGQPTAPVGSASDAGTP